MASFVIPVKAQELDLSGIELPSIPTITKPINQMTKPELQVKIQEIMTAIQQLQTILAQALQQGSGISNIPSSYSFSANLKYGTSSTEVIYLQIFLNADPDTRVSNTGWGSPGQESMYFGSKTKQAVIKFQEKYASEILTPWKLSKGTGFVGQTTRDKINQLLEQYRSGIAPGETLTYCGDGIIQTPNGKGIYEVCDSTNLKSQTCYGLGYASGTLSCSSDCITYNTANCSGGGGVSPIEPEPEPGPQCGDNTDNTCPSGCTHAQDTDCTYCGDNILQRPNNEGILEVCDNNRLNSETCITKGFIGGTLQCSSNCLTFNTASCTSLTSPTNYAPILNTISSKSTNENQAITFTISATDPNNDPLTYSVQNRPSGASFNAATRTFSWTPSYAQSGTYNVTFIVSDSKLTDTETITITVINVNRAPTLTSIGSKIVTAGNNLQFTVSATDQDGDTLTYSSQNLPSGAAFNSLTRTFSWTPSLNQAGSYNLTFRVSDGSLSDSETITITVESAPYCGDGQCNGSENCSSCPQDCGECPSVNNPPVLNTIGNKNINERQTLSFTISATDPDGDVLNYSVQNRPLGSTYVNQTFSWTPSYDQSGTYNVTFIVSDSKLTDTETITIIVYDVNRAPILSSIGNKSINENGTLSFTISAADPDNDPLFYSIQNRPSGASFNAVTGAFTWTPSYDQSGTYDVTFIVSDAEYTDQETITITVSNINRAPVLTSIGDKTATTGTSLTFTVSATDPDNNILTYSASNLPSGATFNTSTKTFSWASASTGTYTSTFIVSDGALTDTETITITVSLGQMTLSVDLTVSTNSSTWQNSLSGTAPLTGVDLRAVISGTATGTINYSFDCNNDGVWDSPDNSEYKGITQTTKEFTNGCSYLNPGTYTAKVMVERNVAIPVQDTVTITVNPAAPICGDGSCNGAETCSTCPQDCGECSPLPQDYVSYWKFEGNANDEKGVNNGTLTGNAGIGIDSEKGNILSLDGNGDYVGVADSSSLDIGDQISLSVWVKLNSYSSWSKLIIKPYQADADPWELYTIDLGGNGNTPRFILTDGIPGGNSAILVHNSTISLNQWYHIVGTYNGNTANLYINGNFVTNQSANFDIGINNTSLGIGGFGTYCVNGLMDDVMIYNRALTAAEVSDIYDVQKVEPTVPVCGNNIKETGELCDGTDLAGETCVSQGYDSGTLFCLSNCSGFNTNSCESVICTDECSPSGSTQCSGAAGYQTCGDYDADPCLEWSSVTNCAGGEVCSGGVCVSSGDTFYVDKNSLGGSCLNSYTRAQNDISHPWCAIQHAADVVVAGDTILVRAGDYSSEGIISVNRGGTTGNIITIKSEPRRQAVLTRLNINFPYIRISGFEITNDLGITNGNGIVINGDNIEIIDNYIHHIDYMGISVSGAKNNIYISDNYMYYIGFGMNINGNNWIVENNEIERLVQVVLMSAGGHDADYSRFFGINNIIRNNYFHGTLQSEIGDAHTDCFQTYNIGGSFAHNVTIEKNICTGFFGQGVIARTETTGYLTGLKIKNNIFAGNGANAWGVMGQNLEDVVIVNNVISNIRWYGVGLNDASDNAVIMNNIFYNIAGEVYYSQGANFNGDYNIIYGGGSTPHLGTHDLVGVNPLFVNPAIFDFRLQNNSPAINAGINTSIYGVIEDIVGTSRPQGAGYDIGAYEYEYTGPSCGDGVCEAGENCPTDVGGCADNVCYEPTCINGCSQAAVIYGGNDEGCLSPNICNGAGNCITDPCAGIAQCSDYTVQNECENNDCVVTGSCQWNAGVCEPASIPITTSVSQFGITWTFSGSVEYGQFANGDYWVVGPVTIININPASGNDGTGRIVNGSMINPSPTSGYLQGYDSTMYGSYGPQYYTPSLNVARPNGQQLSSSNPLTIQTGSLVSTIGLSPSHELYGRTVLQTAAVLTVLSSPVPEGSFRPPYSGSDKTIKFNKNQLDYSSLARLAPVASTPRLEQQQGDGIYDSVERMFERPWLDHIPLYGGMGRQHHPTDNMPNYGGHSTGIGAEVGIGALMLNLDYTNQQKETLLIRYVQTGIDQYGIIQDGGRDNFIGTGAQTPGHKLPILFAGVILNDNNMRNIGSVSGEYLYSGSYGPGNPPPDYVHFGEDDQTFYVAQLDVDVTHSGSWNPDSRDAQRIPYDTGDIGLPEWGITHAVGPGHSNKYWGTAYRTIAGPSFPGMVLATHIMDIRDLWNHDALFDYTDRYVDVESGYVPTLFVRNMWNTYRDNYGCVWTRYNQSDIYSNGHNPCE